MISRDEIVFKVPRQLITMQASATLAVLRGNVLPRGIDSLEPDSMPYARPWREVPGYLPVAVELVPDQTAKSAGVPAEYYCQSYAGIV